MWRVLWIPAAVLLVLAVSCDKEDHEDSPQTLGLVRLRLAWLPLDSMAVSLAVDDSVWATDLTAAYVGPERPVLQAGEHHFTVARVDTNLPPFEQNFTLAAGGQYTVVFSQERWNVWGYCFADSSVRDTISPVLRLVNARDGDSVSAVAEYYRLIVWSAVAAPGTASSYSATWPNADSRVSLWPYDLDPLGMAVCSLSPLRLEEDHVYSLYAFGSEKRAVRPGALRVVIIEDYPASRIFVNP